MESVFHRMNKFPHCPTQSHSHSVYIDSLNSWLGSQTIFHHVIQFNQLRFDEMKEKEKEEEKQMMSQM